ncbi:hypothetical protein GCM10023320_81320 [Pseudonocardia adelaidensis]|uniref:Type IV secretion system coupling TraD/TrwB family protein n=1 Tax=Pseudonocardia adelaidensis TaxID=648754 RepID=A0ABP9P777_9PSEU
MDELSAGGAAEQLTEWAGWAATTAGAAAAVIATVSAGHRWRMGRQQARCHANARLVTILPPPRVDPDGAVALWANLLGLLRPRWARLWHGQPHLGFDYLSSQHGIQIRIWVPGPIPPGLIEQAITAAWPGARTTTAPAPPHRSPTPRRLFPLPQQPARSVQPGQLVVAGGELRLARGDALPIGHDPRRPDPIRALLAAPGPLGPGEYAGVQILARPITGRRLTTRTHGPTGGVFGVAGPLVRGLLGTAVMLLREVLDIATPAAGDRRTTITGSASRSVQVGPRERLVASAEHRAAAAKTRGGAYATLVRYATTTPLPEHDGTAAGLAQAQARARAVLRGRAHALASAFAGFSDHNHYRRHRLRHPLHTMRARRLGRGDVLSVAELAAIAHLPTDEHIPGLRRAGAAAIAPPPQIPHPGPGVKLLGDSDATPLTSITSNPGRNQADRPGSPSPGAAGQRRGRAVGLAVADARHHLHVIGPTGSGKSSLLAQLVLDDAHAGRGVLVIDPKGDLINDITHHLPAEAWRAGRVVVLDPDANRPPPCLNPLASHPAAEAALRTRWAGDPLVENIVSVFARLWAATWGPRTEDLLRVALLTLRASPETPTLAQVPALLTDPTARYRASRHLRDPLLRGFWHTYNQLSDPARTTITAPLLNKLRAVLLRPFAHHLLAGDQPGGRSDGRSTVSLTHVLDRGGILLARLPKGRLGDDTTRLIGSLILAQAWQATTARAHQPAFTRADASLVLDECQNFLNLPYTIEEMLAEARGFHVSITLANQHLAQLPRPLRDGIATNARNKIIFSVSPDDARDLARHTRPELSEHDLANLDGFHAAARLIVNGATTPAFTLTTRPLPHHTQPRHGPAA